MKTETAIILLVGLIFTLAMCGIIYEKHLEHAEAVEAIKGGLVQKIEGNRTIWIKP